MSSPAERKRAELAAKRMALREELDLWSSLSVAGQPLEKHSSQIARVTVMLEAALADVEKLGDDVERWRAVTDGLLGLHHVWDFFRSKLTLRLVEQLRDPLAAADELAWACSQPYLVAATEGGLVGPEAVREPALVYYDTGSSPFAVARNRAYRSLLPAKRLDQVGSEVVKRLPVPVIGVPWHLQAHVPDTAIVAHEVAHVVDDDLGLTAALLPAVAAALPDGADAAAWEHRLPEVLADVLAALQIGSAYRLALTDMMDPPSGQPEGSDLLYPPGPSRLAILRAVEGRSPGPAPADPGTEEEAVVRALLTTPLPVLGGASLSDVAPFTAADESLARDDGERLLVGYPLKSSDVRVLVAAGVHAFQQDPAGFARPQNKDRTQHPSALLVGAVLRARTSGTRAERGAVADPAEQERRDREAVQARSALDRETGSSLLSLLVDVVDRDAPRAADAPRMHDEPDAAAGSGPAQPGGDPAGDTGR